MRAEDGTAIVPSPLASTRGAERQHGPTDILRHMTLLRVAVTVASFVGKAIRLKLHRPYCAPGEYLPRIAPAVAHGTPAHPRKHAHDATRVRFLIGVKE